MWHYCCSCTHVPKLLEALKTRGVGAALGSELDNTIDGVIKEMNIADAMQPPGSLNEKISTKEMTNLQSQALQYASTANTHQLRLLSRKSNLIIPAAKDPNQHQRTCLHLAARNGHLDTCRWLLSEVNASCHLLDKDGKTALDLAEECGHTDVVGLLKSWLDYSKPSSKQNANNQSVDQPVQDIYRLVEKQLRGIRNKNQLCTLLRNNRNGVSSAMTSGTQITHIIGCPLDEADDERDVELIKALAEEHGAVLLRNFIPREVDQLALGALALRPLKLEYDDTLNYMYPCGIEKACDPLESLANKSSMGMARRKMEEIKSLVHISADSSVVVQTNFGPQSLLYSQSRAASDVATPQSIQDTSSSDNPTKKRKIDFFPLSKLRYLNLGEWNYNWGDRKYEKVSGAMKLSESLVALAQRAYSIAKQRTNILEIIPPIPFNMAICNLYHLQRPSDRLGGHQDNVESNLSLPLVTISLGAPGIFLLGGTSRGVMPTAILLRAGDCMVLGGKSRGYFHGVPTILEHECEEPINKNESFETVFPEINGDGSFNEGAAVDCNKERNDVIPTKKECLFVKAFLSTLRMNLSIREV